MKELWIFFIAGLAVALWLHFDRNHGFALNIARRHCQDMGVQLLDQTIVLAAVKMQRSSSGWIELAGRYKFEFSTTGDRRYSGVAMMAGRRLLSIQLEPHVIQ